ncbi:cell division initiation protein [Streptomyces sp. Tu 3180]|uniref:ATP synthase F0 subunit B n=1 Tax=Streptomyces sp. Tu 3180 TaxID=2682611 RepID=UPI001357A6A3|nr:cell division initiation protein [Streptomyces sp. Tu 3180]KAF3467706.1 cell division initiation protein [Streptomyces sp. Tu 3180]
MDVQKKLDEIVAAVSSARSMPMSASCVVNRAELLSMLDEVRAALPDSLAQAQELIGGREQMVEQARQEAERIIESAHAERGSLIAGTEVARRSQAEADRILAEARKEAEEIRAEADDYVDSKLANFEVVLTKTLGSVGRGREKLLGTGPGLDEQGYEDEDAPERSHDPETLRRTADEYVDAKLGAFEAVLAKTLEAVGRGRQKLHGRIATDDLGALADDTTTVQHSSDADYLADLASLAEQDSPARRPAPEPQQQAYAQPEPAYPPAPGYAPAGGAPHQQQPDPYAGYQQQYGGPQDPYGYQQADPYAAYQGYDAGQQAYDPDQARQPAHDQQAHQAQQGYALDETSLFDTSMITPEQLRAYERERGL